VRPVAHRLPADLVHRVPVVRTFTLPVSPRHPGTRIRLRTDGEDMAVLLFWHGIEAWEPEVIDVLARLAPVVDGSTCLDVGANVGVFSLVLAALNPAVQVHAFEPVPASIAALRRNIAVNCVADAVHAHDVALSDAEGSARIHVPRQAGGKPCDASLLADFRADTDTFDVRTTTIDHFVATHGIRAVGVIKVDTEGTEHQVLAGARRTLEHHRPFVFCEVLYNWPAEPHIGPLFDELGYAAYHLTEDGPLPVTEVRGDPNYAQLNFFFAHRDRVSEVW
jgi:FkbM family methyltransferase